MDDPSQLEVADIDLATVKTRSISGVITLITRSAVLQVVSTVGFLLLSIFLGRPEIGLFIAVNDLVSILGYFSDIGLAASLIQKKEKVTLTDLRTTFTLQQILVLLLIGLSLIFSGWLFTYYQIARNASWLFYSLLAAFFLASLKTIPSVVLERQMKFQILASVEVLETIVFYVVAVTLAWRGQGVASYAWAVILRGLLGVSLLYFLAPWKIGLAVSRHSLKTLLSFGLPFQLNSFMAVIKDRFLNIILWKIIGADGVGVIGWAQTWSQKPLRFIMDNVTKVTFPAFARIQGDADKLKLAIEKTLFFITLIVFPVVGGLAVTAPLIVQIIPRYEKWSVALIPLALYCFNSAWAAISTPLTNTLNAIGKVKINTYLMIMWTSLTWIFTPYLAGRFGYLGVAYATALIAMSSIVPVIIVRQITGFSLKKSVLPPLFAVLLMMGISYSQMIFLPKNLLYLLINISISGLFYLFIIYLIKGPALLSDVRIFTHAFKKN